MIGLRVDGRHDRGRRPARRDARGRLRRRHRRARFDLLVEVVCEDDDHLLDLITHADPDPARGRSTETFVYLKLRKQLYNWGTR